MKVKSLLMNFCFFRISFFTKQLEFSSPHANPTMAATSKRNRGSAVRDGAKMTAAEYHELIGKHEHIEHKALRQEVAEEFASITNQQCTQQLLAANALLNPPQPPPLPLEPNRAKNQGFRASAPWPKLSVIQRAAHMFRSSIYRPPVVERYLQSVKVPQIQIDIAKEVYRLMEESERYWKKKQSLSNTPRPYVGRYNVTTRKYALQKAPWSLQLAMTLTDFHVDHIVDIVYKKPFWAKDFVDDEPVTGTGTDSPRLRRKERSTQSSTYRSSPEERTTEYGTSAFYESTEAEEEELDSDEQPIDGPMSESSGIGGMILGKLTTLKSKEEMDEIDRNIKAQTGQSLDSMFANMFDGLGGDKPVAFADGFELNLESDGSFDVAEDGEDKEKEELCDVDKEILDNFDADYPRLSREQITEIFLEEGKDVDATKCRLDMMDTNTFMKFSE